MNKNDLRRQILRFLLDRDHNRTDDEPSVKEIAEVIGVDKKEVVDQLEILRETETLVFQDFEDDYSLYINPQGKLFLEFLESNIDSSQLSSKNNAWDEIKKAHNVNELELREKISFISPTFKEQVQQWQSHLAFCSPGISWVYC